MQLSQVHASFVELDVHRRRVNRSASLLTHIPTRRIPGEPLVDVVHVPQLPSLINKVTDEDLLPSFAFCLQRLRCCPGPMSLECLIA